MTRLAKDSLGNTLPAYRWGKPHELYVGDEPQRTAPFSEKTTVVAVYATVDVRFRLGRSPVADEACNRIPGGLWMPLRVEPGESMSVVGCGEDGEIQITEME